MDYWVDRKNNEEEMKRRKKIIVRKFSELLSEVGKWLSEREEGIVFVGEEKRFIKWIDDWRWVEVVVNVCGCFEVGFNECVSVGEMSEVYERLNCNSGEMFVFGLEKRYGLKESCGCGYKDVKENGVHVWKIDWCDGYWVVEESGRWVDLNMVWKKGN